MMITVCEICGAKIENNYNRLRKYCSTECKKQGARINHRLRYDREKGYYKPSGRNKIQAFCDDARVKGMNYEQAQMQETLAKITPERWKKRGGKSVSKGFN